MDIKTLRAFEQELIPARAIATANAELEVYLNSEIGKAVGTDGAGAGLVSQGFDAGYAAAMRQVVVILGRLQNEALRAPTVVTHDDVPRRATPTVVPPQHQRWCNLDRDHEGRCMADPSRPPAEDKVHCVVQGKDVSMMECYSGCAAPEQRDACFGGKVAHTADEG